MNHPSIGGKEQEPQSSDVPKELKRRVGAVLFPGRPFDAWWRLGRYTLGDVLAAVPLGWMKTEQGWVQMEADTLQWSDYHYAGQSIYRVKRPPENQPAS